MEKIQPAVKKETINVTIYTSILTVLSWIVFFIVHLAFPDSISFDHPIFGGMFDYTIFTGGIAGAFIAVLNFFLMGLTVQKVASDTDEDRAKKRMKMSYTYRYLMQIVWIIICIFAPCFQIVAGILPLIFPGIGIKFFGALRSKHNADE